ncbi:MAG: hypothetical protein LBF41_04710 [Deltaproteobacteria bacterium]|jgi:hypothetical protein|nr:hypothetical protein [Deltaproteobacteria bacterium]
MTGLARGILPQIILLAVFMAACVPAGTSTSSPDASKSGVNPSADDPLTVYSGEATRVSNTEYDFRTGPVKDGDFYEAYFDIPATLPRPFIISFDLDYPAQGPNDTVEIKLADPSFGYSTAKGEYWINYYDPDLKKYHTLSSPFRIKDYVFGEKVHLEIHAEDSKRSRKNEYALFIYANGIRWARFYSPERPFYRLGVRVRSAPGVAKSGRIHNLTFLGATDDLNHQRVKTAVRETDRTDKDLTEKYHLLLLKQDILGGDTIAEILENEIADKRRRAIVFDAQER